MKITVVTVAYNEEKNIARTIESVLNQSATEFEYIVCDGLSKDRTVEIAKSYDEAFAKKGISYRVFSEKDRGIYDAMNKGIQHASGQYIWFLNAGDWLCNEGVLARFIQEIQEEDGPAVIYADYYYVDNHRASRFECDDSLLRERMSMGHPSMIARTDIMRGTMFDISYRIAADYNFVLGLKLAGQTFKRLDMCATYFIAGGISGTAREQTNEELRRMRGYYGLPHEDIVEERISAMERLKHALVSVVPVGMWRFWTEKIKHKEWIEY